MKAKNLKAKDINGKSGKLLFADHAFITKIMAINIIPRPQSIIVYNFSNLLIAFV